MAKKSEILRQREKAQRDLIELKKMQAGEIAPGPKPSEEAVLPRTPKEKIVNFFYHYKFLVIGGVFLAVVLTILMVDILKRVDYDSKVVVFSYDTSYSLYNEKIADYFEQIYPDVNENGNVDIAAIDCSVDPSSNNVNLNSGKLTQLSAMLSVEEDAVIYIVDEESVNHFNKNLDTELFKKENMVPLGQDFYDFIKLEDLGSPKTQVFAAIREIDGTLLEGKNEKAYEAGKAVLDILREKAGAEE